MRCCVVNKGRMGGNFGHTSATLRKDALHHIDTADFATLANAPGAVISVVSPLQSKSIIKNHLGAFVQIL